MAKLKRTGLGFNIPPGDWTRLNQIIKYISQFLLSADADAPFTYWYRNEAKSYLYPKFFGDGILLAGTSGEVPVEGEGTRLMWIPSKAAFRAGFVSDTQWDEVNIGDYSFAIGKDVIASADYTFAFGKGYENNTENSFSVGFDQLDLILIEGLANFQDTHIVTTGTGTIGGNEDVVQLIIKGFGGGGGGGGMFITGSTATGIEPFQVAISGNYAYVVNSSYDFPSFQVIDITDPENPANVTSIETDGPPYSVAISGNYAYVVNNVDTEGLSSLQVIDISNPLVPVIVGFLSIADQPTFITISGNFAYITAYGGGPFVFQIIDITDPENPELLGSVEFVGESTCGCIVISGDYAFVTDLVSNNLHSINISDPENPTLVSSISTDLYPTAVAISSNYAYIVNYESSTLQVIDISNPASMEIVGSLAIDYPWWLAILGNYAFVITHSHTLQAIDISNPEDPIVVSFIETEPSLYPIYITIVGSYAYIVNIISSIPGSLQIADISNPIESPINQSFNLQEWRDFEGNVLAGVHGNGSIFTTETLYIGDANTYLAKDGSDNLTFTDIITGTKTLAELAAGGGVSDHSLLSNLEWSLAGHNFDTNLDVTPYELIGEHLRLPETAEVEEGIANNLIIYASEAADTTILRMIDDSGFVSQLARDNWYVARNTSGFEMPAGSVVYVTGATGGWPNIGLAKADSMDTMPATGITAETIEDDHFGKVLVVGILPYDTDVWDEGTRFFVSADVAGEFTDVCPEAPNYCQRVALVLVQGNNGKILVSTEAIISAEGGGGGVSDHDLLNNLDWSLAGHTFDTDLNLNNYYITNGVQPGDSNFVGYEAGYGATYAGASNFFGVQAGYEATGASDSNFFGVQAGYEATDAYGSNFFGYRAGYGVTYVYESNFFGYEAGYGAIAASDSNFFGYQAGYEATDAGSSNFFGVQAGYGATGAYYSNFFGHRAGYGANYASDSNFFGDYAGFYATNANYSNFFGSLAGYEATDAFSSNFFGIEAGYGATDASYSNFFGPSAGFYATYAAYSNFFGFLAGLYATNAAESIFIGSYAGYADFVDNTLGGTSIAIGRFSGTGGFSDSVAIGHGVINSDQYEMNLGNVMKLTGIYADDYQSSDFMTDATVDIGTNTLSVGGFIMPTDAVNGYVLTCDADGVGTWQPDERAIIFVVDGGGNAITVGEKGHLEIPFDCEIEQVTLLADTVGSVVVDIWKDTYGNFPPTVADTICAAAKPTIVADQKYQDDVLTDWIKTINAGDNLAFNVDSVATIKRFTIILKIKVV